MKEILNFINGEYVAGSNWFDKRTPYDGKVIARVAEADKALAHSRHPTATAGTPPRHTSVPCRTGSVTTSCPNQTRSRASNVSPSTTRTGTAANGPGSTARRSESADAGGIRAAEKSVFPDGL